MNATLRLISDPLVRQNPVTVQVLGVCSALAVTRTLVPAVIMSLTLTAVLVLSNVIVSSLRHQLPYNVRLILEMLIIATGVTVADEFLRAYMPDVASTLSVFIGLIVTNCIVLARAEAFAMKNPVWPSALDALGYGLGYSVLLVAVASVRELAGTGQLLGFQVLSLATEGGWFRPLAFMALPASAFFVVAALIWVTGSIRTSAREPDWRFDPAAHRGQG